MYLWIFQVLLHERTEYLYGVINDLPTWFIIYRSKGNQWSLRIKIKNVSMTWLKQKNEKKQHYRYMSLDWFCMKIYRERWLDGFMWQSVYVCIYVINVDDGGLNYTNWFAGYSSRHNISKYFSMYENTQNQLVLNVWWTL